ncbi:MAG: nitrophenyl compound nitroreductase subunit ArsF family protein [Thermogutta sp.]
MNEKRQWQTLLTGALLLLVGAAFGAIAVKLLGEGPAPSPDQSAITSAATSAGTQQAPQVFRDGVIVYLCHGNYRCPTCLTIEATTKEVLDTSFAEEIRSGKILVKEINYEEPSNRSYVQKFQLIAPTVVMVRIKDGQETHFANLMDVWQLVGDKAKFRQFIENNIQQFLSEEAT